MKDMFLPPEPTKRATVSPPQYGTPEFARAYQDYVRSPEWRQLRKQVLIRANGRCERCGLLARPLTIHHLTYERFRNERPTDLQVICNPCHAIADDIRAINSQKRAAAALDAAQYEAALNTYATKKYGEDWMLDGEAYHRIREEFDQWLESQGTGDND
jgi:hypothetical protein